CIPLRRSESLLIGYFLYTSALAVALPIDRAITVTTIGVNTAVIAGAIALAWANSLRHSLLLDVCRDWYTTPLMLLAYRQMGWFALPHSGTALEDAWMVWDRWFLYDFGFKAAIEWFGPLLPSLLEISYSLVYTVAPFSLAALYICHRRERAESFLFTFLFGIFVAYVLFPYFPSEPPRTVYPGQDLPAYLTPFRRFNGVLLAGYGIHTSVFPSAHVSGSFAAALAMIRLLPEKKWVGRYLLVLATMIATATVYGRYHYLVDAVAGLAIAIGAEALGRFIYRRRA
ncbi:MAG: phosphatase PAP2 family protein, partial [Bryobacteraceae bacterium]